MIDRMKPLKRAEEQLREKLEGDGWKIVHKGWPDFACVKDGKVMFVEVKNYSGEMLKKEQHYILTTLAKLGLDCFKWTPYDGFERITSGTPMPIIQKPNIVSRRRLTLEEKIARLSPGEKEMMEKSGKTWYF